MLQAVIFILVLFVEIAWVEFEHNVMKKNDKNKIDKFYFECTVENYLDR